MNPSECILNTDNSQNQFRFYSESLMLSSEPLNLKSMKKCFMSYLILKTYKLKDRKLNLKFCGQLIKISCIAPRPGNLVK